MGKHANLFYLRHAALLKSLFDQYGLQTAFAEIERLHHEVTDGGNPIALDLKTRYVIKGIKKEQTISSKVLIHYDKATNSITKVEDKWDGKLPDSSFTGVSREQLLSPWWWVHYTEGWAWYAWSFTWDMWWWQVRVETPWACLPVSRSTLKNLFQPLNIFRLLTSASFATDFAQTQCGHRAQSGQRSKER